MDNFIRLSSVTEAMKARDILSQYKIFSSVRRIPVRGGAPCSYGIYIKTNLQKALDVLESHGIHPVNYKERAPRDEL